VHLALVMSAGSLPGMFFVRPHHLAGYRERRRSPTSRGTTDAFDGWSKRPSGVLGVLNDAVSLYLAGATLASAFVAR